MNAGESWFVSGEFSMSDPSPPNLALCSWENGMVPGASPCSWSRFSLMDLIGSFRARRFTSGIASIMFTLTIFSSGVVRESCWNMGAILSQTTATFAPWSLQGPSSSRAVYRGLCSATTPPSLWTAKIVIRCCGQFGRVTATRSPGRTPSSRKPAATLLTCFRKSP